MATKKNKTKRKRGKRKSGLRRMPSYVLWLSLAVIAVVYVVFFYRTFVGPYSFRWKAIFTNVTYPEGAIRGIDISHYQQNIKWDELSDASIQGAPVSFVIIKATEGRSIIDRKFKQNFAKAKEHGIIRGAYHFYSPISSAKAQADYFCKTVKLEKGDLPPVLDVEEKGRLTPEQLRSEVKAWMDIVERHYGITPILYTGYKFRTDNLNTPDFDRYPLWIAHYYVDKLEYKGAWTFWQHTDAGKVDGIKGSVDVNIFNGTYEDLEDLTIR